MLLSQNKDRYVTPVDFAERYCDLFYRRARNPVHDIKHQYGAISVVASATVFPRLEELPDQVWNIDELRTIMENFKTCKNVSIENRGETRWAEAKPMSYLRWALYGGRHGPTLPEIMLLLGPKETLCRLTSARKELIEACSGEGGINETVSSR